MSRASQREADIKRAPAIHKPNALLKVLKRMGFHPAMTLSSSAFVEFG
ncbi:hypothetical protein D1BOALGB6SA_3256 [Olavius sp. associated proteobacterium Delta 1]|nr:hypothetical protein D1BOALGB6SA_3256 [Olavius sp. associated proteobacterium Delta 1]